MAATSNLEWRFSQVFGPAEEGSDIDVLSALEFDATGRYVAVGDRGGRIIIFEQKNDNGLPEYKFFTEFESHQPEFDYLKSSEIEEKINKVRWVNPTAQSKLLLTTNDKTTKLWKVSEKKVKAVATDGAAATKGLKVPRLTVQDKMICATPRRLYSAAHAYHINSISLNNDGETFLSADDLRINLWNLNIVSECFNIVDIKPENMDELNEVITSAEFHPTSCNILMYGSTKGTIRLCDMRANALCDQHIRSFEDPDGCDPSISFFSEIISSISDVKFTPDGNQLVSRDYLTIRLWDMRMERAPVHTIELQSHLKPKLCDLYESDCVFDKFDCTIDASGKQYLSGSYHNQFFIHNTETSDCVCVEASPSSMNKSDFSEKIIRLPTTVSEPSEGRKVTTTNVTGGQRRINVDSMNFTKKVLHCDWHPSENVVAIATSNNLFFYSANQAKGEA